MSVYQIKPLKKPNFFQRALNLSPTDNVITEINNLLASVDDIRDIQPEHMEEIADRYNINLSKRYSEDRKALFLKLVKKAIEDNEISDDEAMQLKHLRDLLMLKQQQVQKILKKETEKKYGEEIGKALEDNRLSDKKKQKLEQLRKNLMIDE